MWHQNSMPLSVNPLNELNSQLLQIHSTTDKHSSVHIRWTYIILLAITALLSFPFVISHRFSKSRITITRNLFSCTQEKRVIDVIGANPFLQNFQPPKILHSINVEDFQHWEDIYSGRTNITSIKQRFPTTKNQQQKSYKLKI